MEDMIDATPSDGAASEAVVSEAPAAAEKPSASIRDALSKAFEGVEKPAERTAAERARDEAGRFTSNQPREFSNKAEYKDALQKEGLSEPPKQDALVASPAPSRFSKAAQAEWAKVPEAVRTETERAITELTQGLEKYKSSHEAYEAVRQFDEMAKQSGTDLKTALTAYTNMENLLRRDPVAGIKEVCRNIGIDPAKMAEALTGQPGQVSRGDTPEVAALKAEIQALKQEISGVGSSIREREALAEVNKFAEANPYFEDLSADIAQMLKTGFATTLQDAYDKAVRLNPEVAAKKAAEEAAKAAPKPDLTAQTRKAASLSVTGSPNGSNPVSKTPAGSPREALRNAFSATGLA